MTDLNKTIKELKEKGLIKDTDADKLLGEIEVNNAEIVTYNKKEAKSNIDVKGLDIGFA